MLDLHYTEQNQKGAYFEIRHCFNEKYAGGNMEFAASLEGLNP